MDNLKPGVYIGSDGKEYELFFTAFHATTDDIMVVYQALYGDGIIYTRPAIEWDENFSPK